jgi:hypothetical protein
MQAGQFIVEYCGEIINDQEAVKRSEDYRMEGEDGSLTVLLK